MIGCIRCVVSGHVQGVWFRASTRDRAVALGLAGMARNLSDGRVEVIASGERDKLQALRAWLGKGPPKARVTGVVCEEVPDPGYRGFVTG